MYWLDFFPVSNEDKQNPFKSPFDIKDGESLYFRLKPNFFDWSNIILQSFLYDINIMYQSKKQVA
jgi:hypothetical protein